MTHFNNPAKEAFNLAAKLKEFRAKTEITAYSETNQNAEQERRDVVRQIDWAAFNEIVNQLEFTYKHK